MSDMFYRKMTAPAACISLAIAARLVRVMVMCLVRTRSATLRKFKCFIQADANMVRAQSFWLKYLALPACIPPSLPSLPLLFLHCHPFSCPL